MARTLRLLVGLCGLLWVSLMFQCGPSTPIRETGDEPVVTDQHAGESNVPEATGQDTSTPNESSAQERPIQPDVPTSDAPVTDAQVNDAPSTERPAPTEQPSPTDQPAPTDQPSPTEMGPVEMPVPPEPSGAESGEPVQTERPAETLADNGANDGCPGQCRQGIWTSAAELAGKPMQGDAWDELRRFANGDTSNPNVSDQDDPTNVRVLAAAIVYARNQDAAMKQKVITACQQVIGTQSGGRTLAWGREVGAYALAADLVGYRTQAFEAWLTAMADQYKGSQLNLTLRQMYERRPNNWGTMAFGSLTAIYRYLGNTTALKAVRDYWSAGVVGPNPGFVYGSDLSWHLDPTKPLLINPMGATKQGVNIDGLIPDDMRRGGSFTSGTPTETGYPWEHLQGVIMGAHILERAGLSIWNVGNRAIFRAVSALQDRLKGTFLCAGDDLWMLPFLDRAYNTNWTQTSSSRTWQAGKNAGFPYILP